MPEHHGESGVARFSLELLGRFRVCRFENGAMVPVEVGSRRGKALLAYLALHPDRTLPRARIAGLLWEDRTENAARHNLRQVLTELRDDIGGGLDESFSKESVRVRAGLIDTDAIRFAALCERGTPEDLAAAAELYRGELTHDIDVKAEAFDEWLSVERRRLHALAIDAFDAHIRNLEAAGRKEAALSVCERLLSFDPIREATHRLLIGLEASVNGRSSALHRAAQLADVLKQSVGVTPEPATLELVAAIAAKDAPVQTAVQTSEPDTSPDHFVPASRLRAIAPSRPRRWALAVAVLLAVAALPAIWFGIFGGTNGTPQADLDGEDTAYSIAVLPLSARSEEAKLLRFVRVLEQDLIDSLSHATRFRVTSHLTSRSYRDSQLDAREIGRELQTAFLLSGSAELDAGSITVRAQLIDSKTGAQVWAGQFVHDPAAEKAVFEEIVHGISRRLQVAVLISEGLRRERMERDDPTYGDLIQRGVSESLRSFDNPENEVIALRLFERALEKNPESNAARVGIARVLTRRVAEFRSANRLDDLARVEKMLTEALNSNPNSSSARYFMGILRKQQGRIEDSIAEFEQTLKLNPSHANAHAQLGHSLIFLGRAGEAERHIRKAIRIGPRDPTISAWYFMAGQADIFLGRYDAAIDWFEKSIKLNPASARVQIHLAAAYLLNGNEEKAIEAARAAKRAVPKLSAEWLERQASGKGHPVYLAQRDVVIEATRRALALIMQKATAN
jgi:DNA-binding SARP family transcriptional activator/TolB-like protein